MDSRVSGMRDMQPAERLAVLASVAGMGSEDRQLLAGPGALPLGTADGMIENVIGTFELPMGVATNFQVNGRDVLVPMVVEEP